MSYLCFNSIAANSIRDDLLHIDKCTCFLAEHWYYEMSDQSSHIQAYLLHNKVMKSYWNTKYGLLLEYFDLGNVLDRTCGWPYPNEVEEEKIKNKINKWRRMHSNKRRAHLLKMYRRK